MGTTNRLLILCIKTNFGNIDKGIKRKIKEGLNIEYLEIKINKINIIKRLLDKNLWENNWLN